MSLLLRSLVIMMAGRMLTRSLGAAARETVAWGSAWGPASALALGRGRVRGYSGARAWAAGGRAVSCAVARGEERAVWGGRRGEAVRRMHSAKDRLDDVVKVELLEKESKDKITALWLKHHLKKDCVSAVVPPATYAKLLERTTESPLFVLPLPSTEGNFKMILLQCHAEDNRWLFTSLEDFHKCDDRTPWPPRQRERGRRERGSDGARVRTGWMRTQ